MTRSIQIIPSAKSSPIAPLSRCPVTLQSNFNRFQHFNSSIYHVVLLDEADANVAAAQLFVGFAEEDGARKHANAL